MRNDEMFNNMTRWIYCVSLDELDLNDHRICVLAGDLQKAT